MAGLEADGTTTVIEPARSRNHTELMLPEFGVPVLVEPAGPGEQIRIEGGRELRPVNYQVPGDLSSAAFFIAAAVLGNGSSLSIKGVGLNPTRSGFLDVLDRLGAIISRANVRHVAGEPVGDIKVASSELSSAGKAGILSGPVISNIIDEIPIIAVIATQVSGRLEVRGARELRLKESDRISAIVEGIRAMGGRIEEFEDGFAIEGPQRLVGARIESHGDHRIAMAFSIAALVASGVTEIEDAACAAVSFPEFYRILAGLTGEVVSEVKSDIQSRARQQVPIILVGFMGAGKSTIGKTLAKRLGYEFLDSDAIIESTAGRSIPEIFDELGEDEFRNLERNILRSLSGLTRAVVALGGGAYVSEENRDILRAIGVSIWIDCPFDLCWSRVSKETHRPLLKSYTDMAALIEKRKPAYEQADARIETGSRPPARLVREIIEILGLE